MSYWPLLGSRLGRLINPLVTYCRQYTAWLGCQIRVPKKYASNLLMYLYNFEWHCCSTRAVTVLWLKAYSYHGYYHQIVTPLYLCCHSPVTPLLCYAVSYASVSTPYVAITDKVFWKHMFLAPFHHTKPTVVRILMRAHHFLSPYFVNAEIFGEKFVFEFNSSDTLRSNLT